MDAQPAEEFSSIPAERRETGETLPSHDLLDELMEGPRKRVQYFNDIISGHLPASEQSAREISGELNSYEHHWLKRHLKPINEEYQSIVFSSPETQPERSELSFHIINRFIMPQWHRVLVSPKLPKMDIFDLETAQVQLAIESTDILSTHTAFNREDLLDNELKDIDAMISLLQLSIDGEIRSQPNLIAVPHPEIGNKHHRADFLIFEPSENGSFQKREVQTSEIIDASLAPGTIAANVLKNIRISSICRRPEFQDKTVFRKLLVAREVVRSFNQK